MRKIFAILILILFLTMGCVQKDIQPTKPGVEEEIECDAVTPCSEGYQCVKLPDKTKPTCVLPEVLESDKYKDCRIAESYPPQIICPQTIPAGEGCESDSDCDIGGCNGEICTSKESVNDVDSICLYKPEFECYSLISCKCINNKCAWEQPAEFLSCVTQKRNM